MSPQEKLEKKSESPLATPKTLGDLSLLQISTILYLLMATIGALVALYGHQNFQQIVALPKEKALILHYLGISGLGIGLLLIASFLFEDWFPSYHAIKESVTNLLGPTSIFMAIYLAAISAVGEELLFRGAIMPFAGLAVTSILFGLLHLGPDGSISAWSFWAVLAGLLLGWMFEATGSLWPPILTHFGVNCVSILRLQRVYKRRQTLNKT